MSELLDLLEQAAITIILGVTMSAIVLVSYAIVRGIYG